MSHALYLYGLPLVIAAVITWLIYWIIVRQLTNSEFSNAKVVGRTVAIISFLLISAVIFYVEFFNIQLRQ